MEPKSRYRHLSEAVQHKPQAGALRPVLSANLNHVLVPKVVPFHYITQKPYIPLQIPITLAQQCY